MYISCKIHTSQPLAFPGTVAASIGCWCCRPVVFQTPRFPIGRDGAVAKHDQLKNARELRGLYSSSPIARGSEVVYFGRLVHGFPQRDYFLTCRGHLGSPTEVRSNLHVGKIDSNCPRDQTKI
jgi:hypothetical protein